MAVLAVSKSAAASDAASSTVVLHLLWEYLFRIQSCAV
jgi:hypothetical protein